MDWVTFVKNQDAVSIETRVVTAIFEKPEHARFFANQLQVSLGYAKSLRIWEEIPGEHHVRLKFETKTRSKVLVQHLPLLDRNKTALQDRPLEDRTLTVCSQRYNSDDPNLPVFIHHPNGSVPLCNECERWSEAGSSAP